MKCLNCPNNCNVNRAKNYGKCLANDKISIAKYDIFKYEEPIISYKNGSGNIFFSNCNLKCIYCQNYEINTKPNSGLNISPNELAKIMIKLQNMGCSNINLVTPTIYVDKIIIAIKIAKQMRLVLPIIYNCSGYENVEVIKKLAGLIDIYMPDFKYASNSLGFELSNVKNYLDKTLLAIDEMVSQVGSVSILDYMEKGVLIRNLILPTLANNSIEVLDIIKNRYKDYVCCSVMSQYVPTKRVLELAKFNEIQKEEEYIDKNKEEKKEEEQKQKEKEIIQKYSLYRQITKQEHEKVLKHFFELDFKYGFYQDRESSDLKYIPRWDYL